MSKRKLKRDIVIPEGTIFDTMVAMDDSTYAGVVEDECGTIVVSTQKHDEYFDKVPEPEPYHIKVKVGKLNFSIRRHGRGFCAKIVVTYDDGAGCKHYDIDKSDFSKKRIMLYLAWEKDKHKKTKRTLFGGNIFSFVDEDDGSNIRYRDSFEHNGVCYKICGYYYDYPYHDSMYPYEIFATSLDTGDVVRYVDVERYLKEWEDKSECLHY